MASLKRKAREGTACLKEERDVCLTDSVLELSVTVGYLGADVKKDEIICLDSLLREHCVAGVVALERGETESHLHFQMVCRARCKNARSFGILVRKYMGWYGKKGMTPVGKVTCKVLTNRYVHTFLGMIGYCLKDAGTEHFEHVMHNISDEDVITGKTLHTIYGRADAKQRVTLTNKNITDRMYVWHKYRTHRKLTATFLTTLTDMVQSGIFIPAASWIIPLNGQGMDHRRMSCLWKCITEPHTVCKSDVQEIFVRKRNFVKGRYFDDDESAGTYVSDEDERPLSAIPTESVVEQKPSPTHLRSVLKPSDRSRNARRVLFQESIEVQPSKKSVSFQDKLGDFVALKDNTIMIGNEYINTTNTQYGHGRFQHNVGDIEGPSSGSAGSDGDAAAEKISEVINISSDSEEDTIICESGRKVIYDKMMKMQKAPRYNITSFVIKQEPSSPGSRANG